MAMALHGRQQRRGVSERHRGRGDHSGSRMLGSDWGQTDNYDGTL